MEKGNIQIKNREAAFAGQFYPGTKDELKRELTKLFRQAVGGKESFPHLRALISPHAGYIFSGAVAASAYNQISEPANYKRVFVLASSHQYSFRGAAVYSKGNYETPLGEIPVDLELAKKLDLSSSWFFEKPEAHLHEHSLEVQLPFLQHKLGSNFLLVPLIIGTNSAADCKQIAAVLKPWFTPENLFVVSTDFSHYPEYSDARKVDSRTAEAICTNRPQKLLDILEENKQLGIRRLATSLCGWTSVLTLLYLSQSEKLTFEKISYQNSGDAEIYGDRQRVVGYWSIAVFNQSELFLISEKEKKELVEKARKSISNYLKTGKRGKILSPESPGILNMVAGVFVSIYVKDELRGCIGGFAQEETLNDLTQKMAVSAACDYRFERLHFSEMEKMELEISILSPLKRVETIDEIELGRHGIYIKKGVHSGTFLPQVASKTNWSLNEFIGHCARDKAGIGWDGWKTAEIYTYEAIVFRENEL
ncbi:MAG: AmmeMemoRadiSam system protein B [Prolixibacteraceae bacterium]|nr:AmmeMemoRadiSam system protein B [Prolixibacteraceae bacterium]